MADGRVVVDTNTLISRLLLPGSVPAAAVRKAVREARLLGSEATLSELADVLSRSKFDRYLTILERQEFVRLLGRFIEMVAITHSVRACRDPRDDKFLELALNGSADIIVTGDRDLLALDPSRGIRIVTPARYLAD
jgi:putative PIN family toxin of toxin-antitoxin system